MAKVPVNGIEIYYEVHGEGPPLVFAHGAGGNHLSWWQQIPAFASRYQCVIYDQRGFGQSDDESEGPGAAAFVEDLTALVDHLGLSEMRLVAQSMGGLAALGLTLAQPERVKALVMADTVVGMGREAWNAADEETRQRLQAVWQGRQESDAGRALAPGFSRRDPERGFLYRELAALNPSRPGDFLRRWGDSGTTPETLAHLSVPVLFLVGEEDDLQPPELARVAHRLMPASRLVVVPGAGHSIYFEMPDAFNAIVLSFLAEVDGN